MKAAIKSLHSPDVDDLAAWFPPDPTCFGFLLEALIGPRDSEGEESFGFVVCTAAWLAKQGREPVFLRHYLLVEEYDYPQIREMISKLVKSASGATWDEIGIYLSRYGRWEFEDYRD